MNIVVDTHAHTLVSGHAYSTIHEMARAGAGHGLKVLALTEHAPQMPGTCGEFYFENLKVVPREMEGIRLLLGAEVNIMNEKGEVDLDNRILKNLDIVLASIHRPTWGVGKSKKEITNAYVNAMNNPYVSIIAHPDDERFPVDYDVLVKHAKRTGTLLEVNNSSLRTDTMRQNAKENIVRMLKLCKEHRVPITTGSDAHVDVDAGGFDLVKQVLKECDFPEKLVVTTSFEKLKTFLPKLRQGL